MNVLVKGMEMPLNCATCYRDGTHYHVHMLAGCPFLRESIHSHDFRKERHPNCPLTELPPYGRLVDMGEIEERIDSCCDDIDCPKTCNECAVQIVMNKVFDVPTIIEAEEEQA